MSEHMSEHMSNQVVYQVLDLSTELEKERLRVGSLVADVHAARSSNDELAAQLDAKQVNHNYIGQLDAKQVNHDYIGQLDAKQASTRRWQRSKPCFYKHLKPTLLHSEQFLYGCYIHVSLHTAFRITRLQTADSASQV